MSKAEDIYGLDLSQLVRVYSLHVYELNGRPVCIRKVEGLAKCGQCDRIAKVIVFELWGGKRLDEDASQLHRVWNWCGECEDSPFPTIADAR